MPTRLLLLLALAGPLLAGCGNDRQPPPDVMTPGPPLGSNPATFPAAGLDFKAPAGWDLRPGEPPLVASMSTGTAVVSVFRYPRDGLPLPATRGELDGALTALAGAARVRDTTFTEVARGRLRVDGRPGIVLRGTETVAGRVRTVRSTHIFAFGGEVVIDAFAPAADFKRVDAETFRALVRSLQITEPVA